MADNEQNTYAGGAGPVVAPVGNSILDAFGKLASVAIQTAGGVYGVYDSIKERELAREIAKANATQPPQQAMPASAVNSPADYFSEPQRVQVAIISAASIAMLLTAGILIFKRTRR